MASAGRYAAVIVFMAVVLASGYLHGRQTYRWVEKPSLDQYLARLDQIPESFGDWYSKTETFQDDLSHHGIERYLLRTYINSRSTESYRVLVVCGRPGPIASHTPDVCYRSSGYTPHGDQKRADITITDELSPYKGNQYQLNYMKFQPPKSRPTDMELEIRWAWMAPSKKLQVPDVPRYEFASQPALYKVYIIDERASVAAGPTNSPVGLSNPLPETAPASLHDPKKFLEAFLPRLEEKLRDPQKPQ